MDDEIRQILYKIKGNVIDLKDIFIKFRDWAGECNRTLYQIVRMEEDREREKEAKKKPVSFGVLFTSVSKETFFNPDNMKYPGDLFYFPGQIGPDSYYDDTMALEYLQEMLIPPFLIKGIPQELDVYKNLHSTLYTLNKYRCYALALKKAFHVLAQKETSPVSSFALSLLYERLIGISGKTHNLWDTFCKKDKQRVQNRENQKQSDKKQQRLESLKLHPKYPEFFEAIKRYRGSSKWKDKTVLNKLLTEMTGIKNSITIKNYRNDLLEEYINSEKR